MAKITMRFPEGDIRDVDESDLITAQAQGAKQVNRYQLDPTITDPPEPIVQLKKEATIGKS